MLIEIFILAAVLGVIPGAIAHSKGHSFFGWWFLGLFCFLPALIAAIVIKPDYELIERRRMRQGMKRCPYCAEVVKGEAVICRYCQRELPQSSYYDYQQATSSSRAKWVVALLLILIIIPGGLFLLWVNNKESISRYNLQNPKSDKPKLSDSERLDVSKPTFSTAGIQFTLNDKRVNTSLWVSVDVGKASADKNLLGWVASSGVKPSVVSVSFRDCNYMDAGMNSLVSAITCKVTVGAKLKVGDKIVYTTFDIPIDDLRTPLLSSFKDTK